MEIIIFIIIILVACCNRTVPPGKEAIVRRNGEIYKTYKSGEKFYINPFTDAVEFISKNKQQSKYPNVNYINPLPQSGYGATTTTSSQKGIKTFSFNSSYPFRSIDGKSLYIKIYALFRTATASTVATASIENAMKKEIVSYYSSLNAEEISNNATRHELSLFDHLRDTFSNDAIRLERFEATPSNARITTHNTHNKAPCSHYDEPQKKYNSYDPKYSYSSGNAIKSSLIDTIAEQSQNPISGDSYSDNPIKETFNITTVFNGTNMIDVNNMDSNVDPIENK